MADANKIRTLFVSMKNACWFAKAFGKLRHFLLKFLENLCAIGIGFVTTIRAFTTDLKVCDTDHKNNHWHYKGNRVCVHTLTCSTPTPQIPKINRSS